MLEYVTNANDEIAAMQEMARALEGLDEAAVERVLRWACARFGILPGRGAAGGSTLPSAETGELPRFESLADLYAAADPGTEADRALVAGYWHQFVEGQETFGSQLLNSGLKNLGQGVSNITKALGTSMAQKPALVMQVRKSGTTRQARKLYKLTSAGKKAVEMMIAQD